MQLTKLHVNNNLKDRQRQCNYMKVGAFKARQNSEIKTHILKNYRGLQCF